MDYSSIMQLITTVGFPIVMCGAMCWYVKYITDQHREDTMERENSHKAEMNSVTEAITNNTLVIQHLCDLMGKGVGIND